MIVFNIILIVMITIFDELRIMEIYNSFDWSIFGHFIYLHLNTDKIDFIVMFRLIHKWQIL